MYVYFRPSVWTKHGIVIVMIGIIITQNIRFDSSLTDESVKIVK